MKNELIAGAIGTGLGITGTVTQTNETLEMISLIVTICGALVSFVIVPLLNWYKSAKKDGKITLEEWKDAADQVKDGLDKFNDKRKEIEKGKNHKND